MRTRGRLLQKKTQIVSESFRNGDFESKTGMADAMTDTHENDFRLRRPGEKPEIVLVLRPLPGFAPRPDLAIALKRLLREHRMQCIDHYEVRTGAQERRRKSA